MRIAILASLASFIACTEASDPVLLFEKSVGLRRIDGFRSEQRRSLRETSNLAGNGDHERTRAMFDRALVAKNDSNSTGNIFTRSIEFNVCDFESLQKGTCTVAEFCNHLSKDSYSITRCQGDFSRYWEITTQDPEVCYYIGEAVGQPFNETKFNAETDFCSRWGGMFYMNVVEAEGYEITVEITRPVNGVYREINDLHSCENPELDLGFITGYCDSCSAVAIDGKPCNYCESCPEDSLGQVKVDCSNLDASLVMSCETNDDDIFTPFSQYVGAECTFTALVNGWCSLSMFCSQLEAVRGGTATCLGDIEGRWTIELRREESCYYQDNDSEGLPFDSGRFDEDVDYCSNSTVILAFEKDSLQHEDFVYQITRPQEAQGTVHELSELEPCEVETPEYFFAGGYCYAGCPVVTIGGTLCNTNCITCADGYEALDCSNIDPAMIESCNTAVDDDFVEEVALFFESRRGQGKTPTATETLTSEGGSEWGGLESGGVLESTGGILENVNGESSGSEGITRLGDEDDGAGFTDDGGIRRAGGQSSNSSTSTARWSTLLIFVLPLMF